MRQNKKLKVKSKKNNKTKSRNRNCNNTNNIYNNHRHHIRAMIFSIGLLLVGWYAFNNPNQLANGRAMWLFVFGALVGLIDIPKIEQNSFLMAAIGLMLSTGVPFQNIRYFGIGIYIKAILMNLALFATPAVIIVAIRIIYRLLLESLE